MIFINCVHVHITCDQIDHQPASRHQYSIHLIFIHHHRLQHKCRFATKNRTEQNTHIHDHILSQHWTHTQTHEIFWPTTKNKSSSLLSQYCILCHTHTQLFYMWCCSIRSSRCARIQFYSHGHRAYLYVVVNWKHPKITQHRIHNYRLAARRVPHRRAHTTPRPITPHRATVWIRRLYGAKQVQIISICIRHRCHRWMLPTYRRIGIRLVQLPHRAHVRRPINGVPCPKRNHRGPTKSPINTKFRHTTNNYRCYQIVNTNQSKYSKVRRRMFIWKRSVNGYPMIRTTVAMIDCRMAFTIDEWIDRLRLHPKICWSIRTKALFICDDQHRI